MRSGCFENVTIVFPSTLRLLCYRHLLSVHTSCEHSWLEMKETCGNAETLLSVFF